MYDRESAACQRRRDEPEHREPVERAAAELAQVVARPGPVADLLTIVECDSAPGRVSVSARA